MKKWIKAAGIRALKTFAQVAITMFTAGQAFFEVNWINVLSISCTASIYSIFTSIAGLPELKMSEEKKNVHRRK